MIKHLTTAYTRPPFHGAGDAECYNPMKKLTILSTIIAIILILNPNVFAESVALGWRASSIPGKSHFGYLSMACLKLNEMPEKYNSFEGEFSVKENVPEVKLEKIYITKGLFEQLTNEGKVLFEEVSFEILDVTKHETENIKKIKFKTKKIEFKEGDNFILVFDNNGYKEYITMEIGSVIIHM